MLFNINTANVTDRGGEILMFESAKSNLSKVQNILVDGGGYIGENFADIGKGKIKCSY